MRIRIILPALFCIFLILTFSVSATTCSFINITQGPQGVQGIQGINGTPGLPGGQGIQGIQGESGVVNMTAGPQGEKGDQGIQGINGTPGIAGYTPIFGIDYFNGSQGIQGNQGIQGVNGTPGIPGDQGIQGINGTPGTPGYTPIFGIDYFNGTQGIQGVNGTPGIPGEKGDQGEQGVANMTAGPVGLPGPDNDAWYIWANGTRAFTGSLSMGGFGLTNLMNPVNAQDAATKNYVDIQKANDTAYASAQPFAVNDTAHFANETSHQTQLQSQAANFSQSFVPYNNGSYVTTYNGSYVEVDNVSYAKLVSDLVRTGNLGSGTADATKYLRGDQSWQVPSGGSGGNGYTIHVLSLSQATVADAAIYVFGGAPKIPTVTTLGLNKIYYPKAGTIKSTELFGYSTTAGTAEAWPCYLVNSTHSGFSNLIQTVSVSATMRRWTNTSMNIPAPAGDYFEVRCNSPTWATNPAALIWSGNVYIE